MSVDFELNEIHWMMDMFNTIDVGLVVLDRKYNICVWNGFMEAHSGLLPSAVKGKDVFDAFPGIDETWFRSKAESVFVLKTRSFTIWEQHPYIFKFKNYRPITGKADYMYQNGTLIPLTNTTGEVSHLCVIIYDVTDEAVNKLELEQANAKLEELSRVDRLTNLYNRGFWEESFSKEFKRQQRSQAKSCLLMFDIDHFKKINDLFGHQGGDAALCFVSQTLKKVLRESDVAGRYGGEEFAVTLVDTDLDGAKVFAERLRKTIEDAVIHYEESEITLTISIGIAQFDGKYTKYEQWIEDADKALYRSKEAGRNTINVA
ncbi:MAG: diguanylate cyclase [Pseudoalteromonas spongiae]|uniref:diguanylate cyclase n=1 Tax=Pseudoalteromonas spongiae TaxID=298657 RepID=A0ABU8ERY1_9GAMM|nr:diguanylate cyclase [Pseudoalteromonas spongiae]MEC8326850.1 diguanylate cyclase [Pseudomonadota bacterium]TMO87814.1 cellulose biosynthesis regulator YedQ [Pseudoalteromonas spongiae]